MIGDISRKHMEKTWVSSRMGKWTLLDDKQK
jgi:hypothetical protein